VRDVLEEHAEQQQRPGDRLGDRDAAEDDLNESPSIYFNRNYGSHRKCGLLLTGNHTSTSYYHSRFLFKR
jgi:hypothetical protein